MPLGVPASVLWVGALHSSLGLILRSGWPLMLGYLRGIFTSGAAAAAPLGVARASLEGLVAGLGHGLPLGAVAQSFAWPYLLQRGAVLPAAAPGAWDAASLGAAAGLGWLLRSSWAGVWRRLRGRGPGPDPLALGSAIVPCILLQWRLGAWAGRLEAAAAVGLLLACTGLVLQVCERWAAGSARPGADLPPWLAFCGGLAAGLGVLPGLSALAILLAAGLYGRLGAEEAGRFALMAATGVLALRGLGGLPSLALGLQVSLVPLAATAAAGAAAGGALLLGLLRAGDRRALPVLGSYCTALGAMLLVFGVLQR